MKNTKILCEKTLIFSSNVFRDCTGLSPCNGLAPCSSKLKRTKHSHNASAYDTCNGHTRLATSRPWGREGAGE